MCLNESFPAVLKAIYAVKCVYIWKEITTTDYHNGY